MIATWLVEIYLSKINTLEDLAASSAGSDDIDNFKAEQKDLEDEFKGFLEQYPIKTHPASAAKQTAAPSCWRN